MSQVVNADPIVSAALFQTWYRQLGVVSIHIGIKDVIASAQRLISDRGGTLTEVIPDRVYVWRGVEAFPDTGARMNLWLFGSPNRNKNSVLLRIGFWKFNIIDIASAMRGKPSANIS